MTEMSGELNPRGPILRVFQALAKPGCEQALARKLESSSVAVVKGQPGNLGYLAGSPAVAGTREFIFFSIWSDAAALVDRFGDAWRSAHLPEGYEELIETCSVRHYSITAEDRRHRAGRVCR